MFTYHSLASKLQLPVGNLFVPWAPLMSFGGILGSAVIIATPIYNPWWSVLLLICAVECSIRPLVLTLRIKAQIAGLILGVSGIIMVLWQIYSK